MFTGLSAWGQALETIGQMVAPIPDEQDTSKDQMIDQHEDEDDESPFDNKILKFIQQRTEEISVGKKESGSLEPSSPSSLVSVPLDEDSQHSQDSTQFGYQQRMVRSTSDASTTSQSGNSSLIYIADLEKRIENLTLELQESDETKKNQQRTFLEKIQKLEFECNKKSTVVKDNEKLQSSITAQEKEIESFQTFVLELKQKLLLFQNENIQLKNKNAQLKEDLEISKLMPTPEVTEEEPKSTPTISEEEHDKLKQDFQTLQAKNLEIIEELTHAKALHQAVTTQLTQLQKSYDELKSQSTLQQKLSKESEFIHERKVSEYEHALSQLETQMKRNSEIEKNSKQMEGELKNLIKEKQTLSEEVTKLKSSLLEEQTKTRHGKAPTLSDSEIVDVTQIVTDAQAQTVKENRVQQTDQEEIPLISSSQFPQITEDDVLQRLQAQRNELDIFYQSKIESLQQTSLDCLQFLLQEILTLFTTPAEITVTKAEILKRVTAVLTNDDPTNANTHLDGIQSILQYFEKINEYFEQLHVQIDHTLQQHKYTIQHQQQIFLQVYHLLSPHASSVAKSATTPPPSSMGSDLVTGNAAASSVAGSITPGGSTTVEQRKEEEILLTMVHTILQKYQENKQQIQQFQQISIQFQSQTQSLQEQLQDYKGKSLKFENENRQLHQVITQLRSQRTQQHSDSEQIQSELLQLKQQINQYSTLQQVHQSLQSKHQLLEQDFHTLQHEYADYKERFDEQTHTAQAYKQELMTITQSYYTVQQECMNAQWKEKSLIQELTTAQQEIGNLQMVFQMTKKEYQDERNRLDQSYQQQVHGLREEYDQKARQQDEEYQNALVVKEEYLQGQRVAYEEMELRLRKYELEYQQEKKKLQKQLETVITQLNNQDHDVIDRKLILNLIVTYFQRKRSREVLELIAKVLKLEEAHLVILGLRVPPGNLLTNLFASVFSSSSSSSSTAVTASISSASPRTPSSSQKQESTVEGDNLAEMWVNFLINQSSDDGGLDPNQSSSVSNTRNTIQSQSQSSQSLSPTILTLPPSNNTVLLTRDNSLSSVNLDA